MDRNEISSMTMKNNLEEQQQQMDSETTNGTCVTPSPSLLRFDSEMLVTLEPSPYLPR